MWIDVGQVIRESIPDKNGKPLPADLTSGSYEIWDLTHKGIGTLFAGKVIYDKTYGHVTYGCEMCCGYTRFAMFSDPLNIAFDATSSNGVNGLDSCSQRYIDISYDFDGNWSTLDTSIATVDCCGTFTGQGAGSTTSSTFADEPRYISPYSCPILQRYARGGDNVNAPDHLKVLSDKYQSKSTCPTTVRRLITYQEVDVNNASVGTVQSKEQFGSKSANTCNNGNPSTNETCSTDLNGQFIDQLWIGCNSVGGSCGVTYTHQQWLSCPPGGAAAVVIATPGDDIVHNDSVSVGGNTAGFAAGTCIYASGQIANPCK
jgi:hypothetical protein